MSFLGSGEWGDTVQLFVETVYAARTKSPDDVTAHGVLFCPISWSALCNKVKKTYSTCELVVHRNTPVLPDSHSHVRKLKHSTGLSTLCYSMVFNANDTKRLIWGIKS